MRGIARVALVFSVLLVWAAQAAAQGPESAPDFSAMTNTSERKQAFFCYLAPLVENENAHLIQDRKRLVRVHEIHAAGYALDESEWRFVKEMASTYKMSAEQVDAALLDALLLHVDKVSVSLALAQAANESAWGTSRFAREGNNYFGQWCYRKGCGMVPLRRPKGETYEVRVFAETQQSVEAFIANLNSHPAYASFRTIRFNERNQGVVPSALATADGLEKYSARGIEYVKTLKSMIRSNRLKRFDMPDGTENSCRDSTAHAEKEPAAANAPS